MKRDLDLFLTKSRFKVLPKRHSPHSIFREESRLMYKVRIGGCGKLELVNTPAAELPSSTLKAPRSIIIGLQFRMLVELELKNITSQYGDIKYEIGLVLFLSIG